MAGKLPFGMAIHPGSTPKPPTRPVTRTETPAGWLEDVGMQMGLLQTRVDDLAAEILALKTERSRLIDNLRHTEALWDEARTMLRWRPRWSSPVLLAGWLSAAAGWAALIWQVIT